MRNAASGVRWRGAALFVPIEGTLGDAASSAVARAEQHPTGNASGWQIQKELPPFAQGTQSVSCPSSTVCLAVGVLSSGGGAAFAHDRRRERRGANKSSPPSRALRRLMSDRDRLLGRRGAPRSHTGTTDKAVATDGGENWATQGLLLR